MGVQADNLTHPKGVKRYTKRLRKFLARLKIIRVSKTKTKSWEFTMTANNLISAKEIKPLEKRTKREILELLCTQKGWDIMGVKATSANRSSKVVLLEWLMDLV